MIKYLLNLLLYNNLQLNLVNQKLINIELTLENSLIIRGEVNEQTTKLFLSDLYSKNLYSKNLYPLNKNFKDNKTELYLFLDTPGGSVMSGLRDY